MTDDELDEAILAELHSAKRTFDQGQSSRKTRTSKELADATGEPVDRVKDRLRAMHGTGHVHQPPGSSDRWML